MELFTLEIGKTFKYENFRKSFGLTWIFIGAGFALLALCEMLANITPYKSFFTYFFHYLGLFLLVSSLLLAFAGVYRVTGFPADASRVVRQSLRQVGLRSHYILGISFAVFALFIIAVLIEVGISALSHIPFVGPALMAILTAPLFMVNLLLLVLTVCVFAIIPPVVGEAVSVRDFMSELRYLMTKKGLNLVLYIVISFSILAVSMLIIGAISVYALGVTKAVQWKISATYPRLVARWGQPSFITEVLLRITPRPDSVSSFREIGIGSLDFLKMIRWIIGFSYLVIGSFVISFPLSAYFNFSSWFFRRVWRKGSEGRDAA